MFKLYSYQKDRVIPFILERKRSYLSLDMGLGKTACVLKAYEFENDEKTPESLTPMVFICPPFLVNQVIGEIEKWIPEYSNKTRRYPDVGLITVIPDSMLPKITKSHLPKKPFFLVVDEAHRFKNLKARRTKAMFAVADLASRIVYLSGTPMPNGPIELYSVLRHSFKEAIGGMDWYAYARKYCGAHETKWGWDVSGATNLDELAERIKPYFLTIKKEEVLLDLPKKRENLVFLGKDSTPKISKLEHTILSKMSPKDVVKHLISSDHVATYRRELGTLKIGPSLEYIEAILESGLDQKILVFGHHRGTIQSISDNLKKFGSLSITGETPMNLRHEYVKKFQLDSNHRVLVMNTQAGGVGLNLTSATRVIFVEASWVPGENDQAIARAHRIGQSHDVDADFLVFKGSLDAAIIHTNLSKRENIIEMFGQKREESENEENESLLESEI